VLCKRRGILYFAEGLSGIVGQSWHYRPVMLRGDDALVPILFRARHPSDLYRKTTPYGAARRAADEPSLLSGSFSCRVPRQLCKHPEGGSCFVSC
jgi:hypothetical protein